MNCRAPLCTIPTGIYITPENMILYVRKASMCGMMNLTSTHRRLFLNYEQRISGKLRRLPHHYRHQG